MLKAQKRHRAPCKRSEWDQGYNRCACPVVIRGTLAGKHVSLSTAKYLPADQARNMEAARDLALLWERTGGAVRPDGGVPAAPGASSVPKVAGDCRTVTAAVAAFLADARDRGNSVATLAKKRTIFERQLLPWCVDKGIRHVAELDANAIREWRSGWKDEALARSKKQGRVIGFAWFCERAGWLPRNSAADITRALGRIQVKATQTGYFQPAEYARILEATHIYSDRPSVDKHNTLVIGGQRIRALTEVMRWTGLRIRDAATLERRRLAHDPRTGMWSVMVYQRKTGDPVYCPIPPDVAESLQNVPASQKGNANDTYFFWTGHGLAKTLVSNWQRSYRKLFELAGLKEADGSKKRCHPHMFRDTFAVESLLSGMRLEEVSMILGHSSIKITERHYMPWVRARQTSLNQSVVESWVRQGKVKPGKRAPVVKISA